MDDVKVGDRFAWVSDGCNRTWAVVKVDGDSYDLRREDDGAPSPHWHLQGLLAAWTRLPREQADEVVARQVADSKGLASRTKACDEVRCDFAHIEHECVRAKYRKSGAGVIALTPPTGFTITYASGTSTLEWSGEPRTITLPTNKACRWRHEEPAAKPKCRPDCTPANACFAPDVCPIWRECEVDNGMISLAAEKRRWPFTNCVPDDVREAREWRSQRYEPGRNGLGGGFVGSWNKRAVR